MEYNYYKMIIHTGLLLILTSFCQPQRLHLPQLPPLSPEEVNSLEQTHPVQRSINPNHTPNTIEDTVKEVENLIKTNPALPRLTRGEILDILENITSLDATKAQLLGQRDPKAIMVVMPYTPPTNNDQNIEDLYTKPPLTHIIDAEPFKTNEEKESSSNKPKNTRRRPTVTFQETIKKPLGTEEKKKYEVKETSTRTPVRRRRPQTTTTVEPVTTYRPRMVPTTYRPRTSIGSTYHPTRRTTRRRITTSLPEVVTYRNHRYPDHQPKIVPSEGIRIVESPKLDDLSVDYDTKHEIVVPTIKPIEFHQVTTTPKLIEPTTADIIEDIHLPDHFKHLMENMNLESALNPTTTTQNPREQQRIKEMLASIGAITSTTTTTTNMPNVEPVAESLSPEMRDLLMSFGLLANPNSTPAPVEDSVYIPDKADVKPESYIGFKPLPEEGPGRDDMDAILASFGLGRSSRKEKSVKTNQNEEKELNTDMIPDSFKSVLTDIGLNRQAKKIRTPTVEKIVEKQHVFNPDSQYATEDELKKLDKLIGMIKQLEKMNGTVNEEDLKKIDLNSLKELVQSLNGYKEPATLEDIENGPDPTKFDVGLSKNEVKRQKPSESSVSTSISIVEAVTVPSTTTTTTTTESQTSNLKDLEASFGGQPEVVSEATLPETTPARRTGFYSLVDWNTFLDIDDTKGRRVNLRFQPTIGDPKRFYSVTVP